MKKQNGTIRTLLISALASAIAMGTFAPAFSDAGNNDVLGELAKIAPEVLSETADASASATQLVAEGKAFTVTIPIDSSEPIRMEGDVDISVELLEEGNGNRTLVESQGAVVADSENGATAVPVIHNDGSLQIATVISDRLAPMQYRYSVEVEGASIAVLQEDGSVVYLDTEGNYVAGVVADPWLGIDLFGGVTYNKYGWFRGYGTVSISKTIYGQALHDPTNNYIFFTAGWSELDTKDTRDWMKLKKSMREQYDCHVAGGYLNFAGDSWDFEIVRPNTLNGWLFNALNHQCNWNYANGLV